MKIYLAWVNSLLSLNNIKMVDCKIKIAEGGKMPTKGSEKAACYDLYARKIEYKRSGLYKVWLGVHLEPNPGYRVALYPRSSIAKTGWLLANSVGVGDEDYRGEYLAYFAQIDMSNDFPYKVGDRVVQMELVPWEEINFKKVEKLTDTNRGYGGFGSTGKK